MNVAIRTVFTISKADEIEGLAEREIPVTVPWNPLRAGLSLA